MSVLLLNLEKPELEYYFHEMVQAFLPGIKTILSGDWDICLSQKTIFNQIELRLDYASGFFHQKTYLVKNLMDLDDKRIYKRFLYDFLSDYFHKELMWGSMTGIKPVKIVQKLSNKGITEREIFNQLINDYRVSEDRSRLLMDLAKRQQPFIDLGQENYRIGIYLGIPLCPSKCSYCSFVSTLVDKKRNNLESYFNHLLIEIKIIGQFVVKKGLIIDSLYIGGGTPSVLDEKQMAELLGLVEKTFDLSRLREYTFEAGRPDTLSEEKLKIIKDHGVDRICLNPQSMNEKTLKGVSRPYQIGEIEKWVDVIRKLTFKTLNMDLIIGLADETPDDFLKSLNQLLAFQAENITIHNLSIKKGSKIKIDNGIKVKEGYGEGFYQLIKEKMSIFDYQPYYLYRLKYSCGNSENIGYSKAGHEGIYNIMMMSEVQSIIGIGAGATGNLYQREKDLIQKIFTVKDVKTYNERFDEILEKKLITLNNFFKY